MTTPSPDTRLLRTTAQRLGLQAAALVAVTVLVLIALASIVVLHSQEVARERLVHTAAVHADDVSDPPAGIWLTIRRTRATQSSPGLPPGLPLTEDISTVEVTHTPLERSVTVDGRAYRVLTLDTEKGIVQASLDLSADHAERGRLLSALLAGGLGGLALAVVVGGFLGRRAVRPLSDALALQRRFVADASHELRTPLTLLSTRAQLLHRGLLSGHSAESVEADAAGVVDDARHLGEIVEDLLVAADPRVDAAPVDLAALVRAVAASSAAYAHERQVTVEAPDATVAAVAPGQEAALRRALTALVDNAVQHSPPHGTVHLEVTTSRGHTARISVTDEGSGIDPGKRGELLGRFHSEADGTGRRRYGLGLALADEVVGRHGGHLEINPGPGGRGSCFVIVVPSR